jgi:predicted MFS family arabinose efflux permease
VRDLLLMKLLFSAALALFHSVFSLVAAERFGLDAAGVGWLLSFVGVVGIVAQGFLLGPLTRAVGEQRVGLVSALVLAAAFAAFAVISSAAELYAVCVPLTVVSMAYLLINTSQVTKAAPLALKGSLVAVDMALGSLTRMVAPGIGGALLSSYGYSSIGASSAALMLLAAALFAVRTGDFRRTAEGGGGLQGQSEGAVRRCAGHYSASRHTRVPRRHYTVQTNVVACDAAPAAAPPRPHAD